MKKYSFRVSYVATVFEEVVVEAADFQSALVAIARNEYKPLETEILEKFEDSIEISSQGEAIEEPPRFVVVEMPTSGSSH